MARSIATNRTVELAEFLDFVRRRHRLLLATTRRDGSPQISPVTGGVDLQGRIVISTYPARAKTRNVERDPRVSVLVLSDDWNGPWVQVDGDAEVLHMPEAADGLIDYFRCISGEHPDWEEYPGGHAHSGQVADPNHPDPLRRLVDSPPTWPRDSTSCVEGETGHVAP